MGVHQQLPVVPANEGDNVKWLMKFFNGIENMYETLRYTDHELRVRAAEARWRENNQRAKEAGCHCGAPAEVARRDYRVMGSVPAERWTCAEHEGADGFSSGPRGTVALYDRPAKCVGCGVDRFCHGNTSDARTGVIESYSCELKPWEGRPESVDRRVFDVLPGGGLVDVTELQGDRDDH